MGRVMISTNMTLDGTTQDPTGEEGSQRGGWFLRISGTDRDAWDAVLREESQHSSAYLIGGRSYEWFAKRWATRGGEIADLLNGLPKFVVRTHKGRTDWGPTTVVAGDLATEVARLKGEIYGDIVVYASYELLHALLEQSLVDEVRVIVFPHVAGGGGRLFKDLAKPVRLHLTNAKPVGDQLVRLIYDVVESPVA
jgi:dihydrofolate reductase